MGVAIEIKARGSVSDRDKDALLDATEDMGERAHDFFAAQQLEVILSTTFSTETRSMEIPAIAERCESPSAPRAPL